MAILTSQLVVMRGFGLGTTTVLSVRLRSSHVRSSVTKGLGVGASVTALRRVLYLKMVTQCAVLEELGIFFVLANKVWHPLIPQYAF